jgi:biopolymer transport protein ExbD
MQSDINVTPLVDVVLVLLIIFMVITPVVNRVIAVQLPEPPQPAPQPAPPAEPEKQWVVAVTPEGRLTLNDEPVEDADYVQRLKQALAGRTAGGRSVVFKADDRAPYGRLVTALDGAKEAGAEVLGVVTE